MAERTEILSCQLAEYTIGDDNSVEAHLLLPGGAAPMRCKIWPPKYPSEKGQKDAILAFQSGKFKRGEYYMTTIKFKPAPNTGEYRNIIAMSPEPAEAPATGTGTSSGTGGAPAGRRTDATGISIERQVAAKAATDKTLNEGTLEERLAEWDIWADHVISWIQEARSVPEATKPTEPEAEAPAPAPETLAEAAVFDPETMRAQVLEAAGDDRTAVGTAVMEAGFESFLAMGEEDIIALIRRLKGGVSQASPTTPF